VTVDRQCGEAVARSDGLSQWVAGSVARWRSRNGHTSRRGTIRCRWTRMRPRRGDQGRKNKWDTAGNLRPDSCPWLPSPQRKISRLALHGTRSARGWQFVEQRVHQQCQMPKRRVGRRAESSHIGDLGSVGGFGHERILSITMLTAMSQIEQRLRGWPLAAFNAGAWTSCPVLRWPAD
jgi:hypothetical protein